MANTTDMEKMFAALTQSEADDINGGGPAGDFEEFNTLWDKWKAEFMRGWNRYKG